MRFILLGSNPIIFKDGPLPTPFNNNPIYTGPDNSAYSTTVFSQIASSTGVQAYAYCFDNSP